jgi:xanthine dehydrogenase YagT iron-sulfur-binding subunit
MVMKKKFNESTEPKQGVTRRGFIKGVGAGTAAMAVLGTMGAVPTPAKAEVLASDELHRIDLKVNGRSYQLMVEPRWSLLFVLREKLGLTGSKVGCERGECGACTVLMEGVPRYACLTLAVEAEGHDVTTVEGLMAGEELGSVQHAFLEKDAFQCGYCTSGQIMAAEGLLRDTPNPTPPEIQRAMSGNLCRCGAYVHIFQAVDAAAKARGGK